jgi:hypothetical protein
VGVYHLSHPNVRRTCGNGTLENHGSDSHVSGRSVRWFCLFFVLIILYSLYLEYDNACFPSSSGLRARRGSSPPSTLHPHCILNSTQTKKQMNIEWAAQNNRKENGASKWGVFLLGMYCPLCATGVLTSKLPTWYTASWFPSMVNRWNWTTVQRRRDRSACGIRHGLITGIVSEEGRG